MRFVYVLCSLLFCLNCAWAQEARTDQTESTQIQERLSRGEARLQAVMDEFSSGNAINFEDLRGEIDKIQNDIQNIQVSLETSGARSDSPTDDPDGSQTARRAEEREQQLTILNRTDALLRDTQTELLLIDERATRERLQRTVSARRAIIEAWEARLDDVSDEATLLEAREELRSLRDTALEEIAPLKLTRDRSQQSLDRLGSPPTEDLPPEPEDIAEERHSLQAALVIEDAIVRQSELNIANIVRLLESITERRRDLFYSEIMTRSDDLFHISTMQKAWQNAADIVTQVRTRSAAWVNTKRELGQLPRASLTLGLSLAFSLILFFPARRWANHRLIFQVQALEPNSGRRAWVAILRIFTRAVPGVIAGLILMEALRRQGVIDQDTAGLARSTWSAVVALIMIEAGATAILSPSISGWRMLPLERACGQIVKALVLMIAVIFFADRILTEATIVFAGTPELTLVESAFAAALLAVFILLLSRRSIWKLDEHRQDAFSAEAKSAGNRIRQGTFVLGVSIFIAIALGYVALSYFVATRIVLIGTLIITGLFLRVIAREALRSLDRSIAGHKQAAQTESEGERFIFFWLGVLVDLVIALVLLPVVAIVLGFEWVDVRDTVTNAFFGFKVAGVTISLAQILGALGTFIVILGVTRFVQKTGERTFFPRTRLDLGVQNSLKTLLGYVGLVIAALSAVSILGFNLSSLGIIIGALSVGIGFGLQSIVNNFVSGLILLFERPIKVGDWIVVSSGEGTVKRISVRSTEIETWDRSSIIVPNSELISSSVTNWTHKDRMTRVIVPVGVSYDANPREVITLLEGVTKDNRKIVAHPAPFIFFAGFGDSSLDFEIRAFVRETADRLPTQNELRVAAFEALQEAKIEIPFPQRDIHVKSAPTSSDQNAVIADEALESR